MEYKRDWKVLSMLQCEMQVEWQQKMRLKRKANAKA